MWCDQVELGSHSTKQPKSSLSQGATVFIDSDNCSAQWRSRVQDSVGGSLVKFPSNQDFGFHKIIPVRARVISFVRCLLKQQSKGSTKLHPVQTKPLQHGGEGKAVLVISQFSHNLSVSLNNTNTAKNLKLTQVEHACSQHCSPSPLDSS